MKRVPRDPSIARSWAPHRLQKLAVLKPTVARIGRSISSRFASRPPSLRRLAKRSVPSLESIANSPSRASQNVSSIYMPAITEPPAKSRLNAFAARPSVPACESPKMKNLGFIEFFEQRVLAHHVVFRLRGRGVLALLLGLRDESVFA